MDRLKKGLVKSVYQKWRGNHLRLKGCCIAASSAIELMNSSEESIRILASPSIVLVDVRKYVPLGRTPEALEEAQNLRGLGVAISARLSKKCGKSAAFNESTVLSCDGEEARAINFFPQVEAGIVPTMVSA